MTKTQIDNYECYQCDKIGMAELDLKTGIYTCLKCGGEDK